MMKKKALEDKKRKLDEQAAAMLAPKKTRLQKEALPAPSESEIDLVVFSAKHGNLLEKIFEAFGSRGAKPAKTIRKIDISKITPPTSPPSRMSTCLPIGMTSVIRGNRMMWRLSVPVKVVEQVVLVMIVASTGCWGGASSKVPQSHEFENVQAGSWDTHNPACDDFPHAPRWNLTQVNDLDNCREFFSLSPPPAERLFQKKRNRFDLLDDHIHAGINFFATSQEIVREWKLMGVETLEFKNEKKAFAEEKEKFNAEKKRFVANSQKQKDWEIACERTNKELQAQREAIIRMSGEKHKMSEESEQARVASEKREDEYLQRIAKLEKFGEEKAAECKASELLTEELSADCKWLLSHAVPLISERIVKSHELTNYMFELGQAAYNSSQKEGYSEGRAAAASGEKDYHFELFKEDCSGKYATKRLEYEFVEFGIVKAVEKLSRTANAVEFLKKALGVESHGAGGAGPSHPD
ncbi:hypothetical protein Hdeb2414_s0023g00623301 [Helianthus debilis subsp. tardiflorus]